MDEIGERIEQVLNDPAQLERLSGLARSLLGGGGGTPPPEAAVPGLDPALLARLGRLMTEDAGAERRRKKGCGGTQSFLVPRKPAGLRNQFPDFF